MGGLGGLTYRRAGLPLLVDVARLPFLKETRQTRLTPFARMLVLDPLQITVPAVISLVVSVAVAILSFIVNVRVGKERSDRSAMRTMYKSLHEHFSALRTAIRKGEPKQWENYPRHDGYSFPPVRELERVGDINLLPKHLATRFLDVEKQALHAAHKFNRQLVSEVTPAVLTLIESAVEKPYTSVQGVPYSTVSIGTVLVGGQEVVTNLKNQLDSGVRKMLAIGLVGDGQERARLTVAYVTPDKLTDRSINSFVDEISAVAIDAAGGVGEELVKALGAIDALLPVIAKRIRDPHPFSETASSMFQDMFDQSAR